jgi:hypothetical protein
VRVNCLLYTIINKVSFLTIKSVPINLLLIILTTYHQSNLADSSSVVDFATCSAYFFNATKISPLHEYEELFQLGGNAADRVQSLSGSADVMREIGDASNSMMGLIGRDFRRFSELEERYEVPCLELISTESSIK